MEGQAGVCHEYNMLLLAQCFRLPAFLRTIPILTASSAISVQDLLLPQGAAESHCDRQHTTGRGEEELKRGGVQECANVDRFPGQSEFTHAGDGNINKGDVGSRKKMCQ